MALLWRLPSPITTTITPFPLRPISPKFIKMPLNQNNTKASFTNNIMTIQQSKRKLPILLFDIMDTVVRDPFYEDVPAFFGMSLKELVECKHPTAWIEFEKGIIDETELARKFFKDGRTFDLEGLKNCMTRGYSYIEGVEELLRTLKRNNCEMHTLTNYPVWYNMIEDKLKISTYMSWTFCSCISGKRKPDPDFYLEVVRHLNVDPASCIFIDDRINNVEAAMEVGIVGLHFKNAELLRQNLSQLGFDISRNEYHTTQDHFDKDESVSNHFGRITLATSNICCQLEQTDINKFAKMSPGNSFERAR